MLAKAIDAEARKLRTRYENGSGGTGAAGVRGARRRAVPGRAATTVAPDATFTLRLAFGIVKGYEVDGEKLPFHTTFGEAFEQAAKLGGKEPFDLPKRWLDGKDEARPDDAVQLRLDGGHDRRQLAAARC